MTVTGYTYQVSMAGIISFATEAIAWDTAAGTVAATRVGTVAATRVDTVVGMVVDTVVGMAVDTVVGMAVNIDAISR